VEIFPPIHGTRGIPLRREKAGSYRMKNACRGFAFGSSQRNRMTLMFGAAPLLATRLKRFTQLRI
jgi:hypothetical protein